jgi:hypothetical protein
MKGKQDINCSAVSVSHISLASLLAARPESVWCIWMFMFIKECGHHHVTAQHKFLKFPSEFALAHASGSTRLHYNNTWQISEQWIAGSAIAAMVIGAQILQRPCPWINLYSPERLTSLAAPSSVQVNIVYQNSRWLCNMYSRVLVWLLFFLAMLKALFVSLLREKRLCNMCFLS